MLVTADDLLSARSGDWKLVQAMELEQVIVSSVITILSAAE